MHVHAACTSRCVPQFVHSPAPSHALTTRYAHSPAPMRALTPAAARRSFYFLSNDELLEVLSEGRDPAAIQPFVKKVFEAVRELTFEPSGEISGLVSLEGEAIPLAERVNPAASGAAAGWGLRMLPHQQRLARGGWMGRAHCCCRLPVCVGSACSPRDEPAPRHAQQ